MNFLVDTDICSAYLRGRSAVFSHFVQYGGTLCISVVTVAELAVWSRRGTSFATRSQQVQQLTNLLPAVPIDMAVAEKFGEVRAGQLATGKPTPGMDLFIEATALVHDLTLVTHNVQHYAAVPGLRVVDWLTP